MWRTALLVAALLAQTVRAQNVSNATSSSSGTCSAAATTLSTTCGGLCLDSEPCLTYNASATCSSCTVDAAGECQYACFTDAIETSTSGSEYFVMLVTFGSYESEEEIAARAINPNYDTELGQLPDNTSDFAWASNSMLTSIDTIELPADVSYFVVSGGTTFDYVFKSKVVKLEFAADLVATQTQLLDVRLLNINLKSIVGDLPTMLPSSTMSLNLGNTLLSSFPSHLGSITSLETLYLNSNYITSVVATDGIDKLLVLSMRANEMTEFEGAFPMLTTLDLSYNNLTSIPDVVFTYSSLQSLYMTSNQLTTPTFTTAQADFLAALTDFDLIANDFETQVSCATADRRRVHYLTVCISDSAASGNSSSSSSGSATTTDTGDDSNSNTVIIVAIVVGGVVVLCVVVGFIYWRRHRNDGKKADETISTQPTIGISTRAHDSSILSIWTDPEMLNVQVRLEDIQDVRMIGGGAFGVVWLVRYRSSQLLASKRLRPEMASHDRTQYFISEIKLVSKLDHPNIVTFVGAAWSIESDLQALFEYMENGDLRTFLSAASMPRYWNKTKFDIAVNVVEALVYVHSFQPPLVHRDLKSRNVLISTDMVAKLTDFGVSRYQSDNNTMTMGVGTSRWLAPEVIEGTQDYGPAADIFSFGVVLAELDTHAVPYDDAVGPNGHRLQDVAILQMVASGRLRPTFSRSVPPTVLELAQLCMAQEPSERPSAAEVAYVLRSIQREMFGS